MKTKTNLEYIYLAWWLSDLANKKAEALIKKYQKNNYTFFYISVDIHTFILIIDSVSDNAYTT